MEGLEKWLMFIVAMSNAILGYVEKRKARRANDEPTS